MKSNNPRIIQQQAVVVAAYYGDSKGVNIRHLVKLWEESSDFENEYPYVANNFQIRSCPVDGNLILSDLIEEFAYTPHMKIWVMGEELEGEDLNHYLNYLMIGDRCGKPIYQIGQEVCFEYRNEQGDVKVSGIITDIKSKLEFCSWFCKVNENWYDQYLIEGSPMRKSALKTINADIYEIESRILELLAKVGSDKADPPTITTFRVLGLTDNDKAQIEQCALSSLEQFKLLSNVLTEKLQDLNND